MTIRKASRFKDGNLEQEMQKFGYVHLKNFLNLEEIEYLKNLFAGIHQPVDKFLWNSLYDIPVHMRGEISEKVKSVFKPKLEALFENIKFPVATIMSKTPNRTDALFATHRDYTILDEEEFEYRQVWCPLVDTFKENGTLFVMPGSHKKVTRPLATLDVCRFRDYGEATLKYATVINAKAGDLVIYGDRTLHGAFSNTTPFERPVIHFGFYPPEAKLCYGFRNKNLTGNTIEMYEVPDDFYTSQDSIMNYPDANVRLQRPVGFPLVRVLDYPDVNYTEKELEWYCTMSEETNK